VASPHLYNNAYRRHQPCTLAPLLPHRCSGVAYFIRASIFDQRDGCIGEERGRTSWAAFIANGVHQVAQRLRLMCFRSTESCRDWLCA
jgi:hypothetical protein